MDMFDRFANYLGLEHSSEAVKSHSYPPNEGAATESGIGKLVGWITLLAGIWMLVSPQALLGLNQLKWMHDYAFAGEVPLGMLILSVSLYFLGGRRTADNAAPPEKDAVPESAKDTTQD